MADHKIKLDSGAAALLDALHGAGYAAYAVGGCVRDSLLGLTPHDWDLCTSALPRQVLDRFGKEQCIPTGLQHGTVTVKYGGKLYETTTFRTEGSYSDGRHPDSVAFVPNVKEDLARRDFTINAMAYSAEEGLIDPFGGQKDLARGLVRAVGVPHQRFTEDALRILRLYRFAARFGFEIDPATGQAARELCAHLDCVSIERITEELTRLLAAPKPGTWMEPAVFAVVLPELFTPENVPRFEAARAIIDTLPEGLPEVSARLAALLLPLGEQGTRKALKQLRCSNALIEEVTTLVREAGLVPEEKTAAHEPARQSTKQGQNRSTQSRKTAGSRSSGSRSTTARSSSAKSRSTAGRKKKQRRTGNKTVFIVLLAVLLLGLAVRAWSMGAA